MTPAEIEIYVARRSKLTDEVRGILVDALKVRLPREMIDPDVTLFGSGLGLDSVDAIELVIALEERFGILLDESRFKSSLRTVGSLVDVLLETHAVGHA